MDIERANVGAEREKSCCGALPFLFRHDPVSCLVSAFLVGF